MAEDRGGEIGKIMPYWPIILVLGGFLIWGGDSTSTQRAQAQEINVHDRRLNEHDALLNDMQRRLTRIEGTTTEVKALAEETNANTRAIRQALDHPKGR